MVGRLRVLVAGSLVVSTLLAVAAIVSSALPRTAFADTEQAVPDGHVVLIGVPGLRWSDVTRSGTPTLWRLAGQGSAGSMSIRTVDAPTCPIDGWLTISAGNRAKLPGTGCGLPPEPVRADDGAYFADFAAVRRANAETQYSARVGLLGEAVRDAGGCTSAVGPGAALAAATADGRITTYRESADDATPADWSRCPLTVAEIDTIMRAYVDAGVDEDGNALLTEAQRAEAAQRADRAVAEALRAIPADATVLVAGVSDTTDATHMHAAIATGPGTGDARYESSYLTSNSTKRPRIVQITDITPTALGLLDVPVPDPVVGAPWRPGGRHPAAATGDKVETLRGINEAAQAMHRVVPPFFTVLVLGQLLLYGLAATALRRRWKESARAPVLAWTRRIALACAAVPVATFLANLLPWWKPGYPLLAVAGAVVAADAVVLAFALLGPWRRALLGPVTAIAVVTAALLAADVMTGSWLQLSSLLGYSPVVGGRFYGFGNPPYAIYSTAALLAIAGLAEWQRRAGRPRVVGGLVVALGAAVVVIDGWPAWGSDVGGVIALVPGLAVLGFLLTGRRVTVRRLALFSVAGVAIVGAIAYADYLRPPNERTHLGRFVSDLVSGEAGTVVLRKLTAMLGTFGNYWLALLVPFAVLFLVFVLLRPAQWRAAALQRAFERAPALRAGLFAVLVTAMIGFAVNDSGIAVPAVSATVALPLALAASIRALELDEAGAPEAPRPDPDPVHGGPSRRPQPRSRSSRPG